ncbi:MAG: lysylphosphatidylglycerol synthase transmembrane domain-containing protein [Myxococcota bacterium]
MKKTVQLVASLAITGVCFWWTFKDTDWPQMWASLKAANYLWLLPYLGILTLIHLCRTLRWGSLLSGMEKIPFRKLNEASGIGFMMLIVLPFRLGEFARPFLLAQRSSIRRSAAMTTVVLERIVDGIIIAALLRSLVFFLPSDNPELRHLVWGANVMFAVFGGGLLFLLFAVWQRERAVALVRATAGRLSSGAGEKVAGIVDAFVGAMHHLPGPKHLFLFFFFTAGYWVLNGLGMSMMANAFDCTSGGAAVCTPMSLTPFQGYVVLSVLVVGMMIPAAPGSAGTFQAAILIGLSVFLPPAVVNSSGIAYANVIWLTQIAQQVGFGMILMVLGHQSFKDLAGRLSREGELLPLPLGEGRGEGR